MRDRVLTPAGVDDDDFQADAEERAEDAGETDATPMEVLVVSIAKHWSKLQAGQAQAETLDRQQWSERGIIEPPYSPRGLMWLYRNSSALRQNVEAISHNVDGFGWAVEPVFDFEAEDLREQVSTALYLDMYAAWEAAHVTWEEEYGYDEDPAEDPPRPPEMPTPAEVDEAVERWKIEAPVEHAKLRLHFDNACYEQSFVDLRKTTTTDKEIVGWGSWEIVRALGQRGRPVRYIHVPAYQLRLKELCAPVPVRMKVKTSPCHYRTATVYKRFRLIAQQEDDESGIPLRYFKQYGDPRTVSSLTGKVYPNLEAMQHEDGEGPGAVPANEVLWFQDYFPGSAYGAPRFHGAIPEIKGAWLAANHTVDYLENSAIPRGMLLVNDGRLNKRSVRDIKNYFGTVKGRAENRLAVIQAETPRDRALEGSGRVKMEFVDLSGAQRDDASFAEYDKRVDDKVAQQYRLPPLLRGEIRDFNKATASAAMQYAEDQIFAAARNTFDWIVNSTILPELGIRFWRFKSRGPSKQDPEILGKLLEVLLKQGVVVPAEVRSVAERLLSVELMRVAGEWQQLPISLVQQGFKPPDKRAAPGDTSAPKDEPQEESTGEDGDGEQAQVVLKALEDLREVIGGDKFDRTVANYQDSLEADRAQVEQLTGDVPTDG